MAFQSIDPGLHGRWRQDTCNARDLPLPAVPAPLTLLGMNRPDRCPRCPVQALILPGADLKSFDMNAKVS